MVQSYGSVDEYSKGQWRRAGKEIVLTSESSDKDKPDFALDKIMPWNTKFEQFVEDEFVSTANAATLSNCVFLQDKDGVTTQSYPPPYEIVKQDSITKQALAAFEAAKAAERVARAAYENAAAQAMADGRWQRH
jgi:hypothetical protein